MKKNESNGIRPGYLLLLPRGFRWVGIGIMLATIIVNVCGVEKGIPIPKPVSVYLSEALMILGLLFVSSARRKVEDERSIYLRFQALSHAATVVVVWFLLSPLLEGIWDKLNTDSGFSIVFQFLFIYWFLNECWQFFGYPHEKHNQSRKG